MLPVTWARGFAGTRVLDDELQRLTVIVGGICGALLSVEKVRARLLSFELPALQSRADSLMANRFAHALQRSANIFSFIAHT